MIGRFQYILGIDSGTNTGFALYFRPEKRFLILQTIKIHKALDWTLELHRKHPGNLYLRVEDANKATGGRSGDAHMAVGAGSIMRDGRIWRDFMEDYGIPHEMCKPNRKTTKLDSKIFKQITGWQGQTNSHMRDAGMIVWGM